MKYLFELVLPAILLPAFLGWFCTFLCWSISKGSFKWGFLLCQPWPLTKKQRRKLALFYVDETF